MGNMIISFRMFLAVLVFGVVVAGGKFTFAAEDYAPATKSLFLAVKKNDLGAVKRSLLDGADVTVETSGGLTAIDIAIDKGYFPIAHYLLAWRRHLRPKLSKPTPVPAPPFAEAPPVAEAPPIPETPPVAEAPPAPSATVSPLAASTYPQTPTQTTAPVPAPLPAQELIVRSSPPDPAPQVIAPAAAVETVAPVAPIGPSGSPSPPKTAKIVVPDEDEKNPGILARVTDFFSFGSGDDKDPPSPLKDSPPNGGRDSPPETASATENESEPKPKETTETAPDEAKPEAQLAASAEEEAQDGPNILDSIAGFFSSEPASQEPQPAEQPEPAEAPVVQAPAPQASAEPETPPAPSETVAGPPAEPEGEPKAETAPAEPEPEAQPATLAEGEAQDGPNILDSIAGFFSSEPASQEPQPAEQPEPAAAPIEQAPATQAPAEPETPPAPSETAAAPPAEQAPLPQTSTEPATLPAPYKTAAPEAADRDAILARIADMLSSGEGKEASTAVTAAEPATAPSPSGPATPSDEADKSEAKPQETALLATPRPPPSPPERAIKPVVGMSMKLGNPRATKSSNVCVRKKALDNWFCVEPVDWTDDIGDAFQVHTTLYRGRKAIVRYEGGVVTQIHALFLKGNFRTIVNHFTERFGAPDEKVDNWAVLAGEPNRRNLTVRWRGAAAEGAGADILEVREIDNLRWSSPPDTKHGVVRLYRKGADPIFRYVSWSDFLLARIERVGN